LGCIAAIARDVEFDRFSHGVQNPQMSPLKSVESEIRSQGSPRNQEVLPINTKEGNNHEEQLVNPLNSRDS